MGFLRYITPTCQFLLALASGESLTPARALAFGCIWLAVAVYSADSARGYWAAMVKERDTQEALEVRLKAD
jgi:chloramphenicol-sensitive protein RarD